MASKLYEAIDSLEEKQLKRLKTFFTLYGSGLLKSDQEIGVALVEYIQNGGKQEAYFWNGVLEGDQLDNKKRIANRLLKAFEQYILLYSLEQDTVLSNLLITEFYTDRGLLKHATHSMKKVEQENKKGKGYFFNYHFNAFWLKELWILLQRRRRVPVRPAEVLLPKLKAYTAFQSIRLLKAEIHEIRVVKKVGEDPVQRTQYLLNEAASILEDSKTKELEVFKYRLDMVLKNEEDIAYQKVKNLINDNTLRLNLRERREMIEDLMNYCTAKTNAGSRVYAKDYIQYIGMLEEMDYLLDGGHLLLPIYLNSVVSGIISGNYNWAKQFVEEKSRFLEESNDFSSEPYKLFMKGFIALYEGKLSESQSFLTDFINSDMYSKNIISKIGADKLLLKVLFLNKEFGVVRSRMRTVERYLKNNKFLPENKVDNNMLFIDLVKKLLKNEKEDVSKMSLTMVDKIWVEQALKVKVF